MISTEAAVDAVVKTEEKLAFGDLISLVAEKLVTFAIHLCVAILIFYVGRWLVHKISGLIRNIMTKRNVDASITSFVHSAVETVLYFIVIIAVVGVLGIETSSFVALFASAGVAIGMAMSGTLQNFAGGVLILTLRPYGVGDYIETQGYAGTVKAIQMFHTIITTPDNKTIIIPNGPLSNGSINNYSRQPSRRLEWTVAVAYGTNFEHAKAVIAEILDSIGEIDRTKDVNIFVGNLADSAVELTVRAWVKSEDYWTVFYRVNELVYATLPQRGIEFPFPQMDVHIQNGN